MSASSELAPVLSAVCTLEPKALLLLNMRPSLSYDQAELHALITDLPGAQGIYVGHSSNQMKYCEHSLAPVGMVAEIKPQQDGSIKYAKTDKGRELGDPLAAASLDIADDYDVALESIWASTTSAYTRRAPVARLAIARCLLETGSAQKVTAIADATGIDRNHTSSHLDQLAKTGLITYEAFDIQTHKIVYSLGKHPIKLRAHASSTLLAAIKKLEEQGSATLDELSEASLLSLSEDKREQISRQGIQDQLARQLWRLAKRGAIERRSRERSSCVSLTESQREFWQRMVDAIEDIGDNPQVRRLWRKRGQDLLSDAERVSRMLERWADRSPRLSTGQVKDVDVLVRRTLRLQAEPIGVTALTAAVEAESGRRISKKAVAKTLRHMKDTGEVEATKDKVTLYTLLTDSHN